MKTAATLLLALLSLASPAFAAKPARTAADWKTVAKTNEGKPITLSVIGTEDIGLVSTDAPYAVVPVTSANADNREMPEIPVLVAPDRIEAFLKSVAPVKTGGRGAFGEKIRKGTFTGTFVTLAGEPAVVIGDVKPEMKLKKPSEILAAQRAAAAENAGNDAATKEEKADTGDKSAKKGDRSPKRDSDAKKH